MRKVGTEGLWVGVMAVLLGGRSRLTAPLEEEDAGTAAI
jgi:hypothetical protein